MSYLFKEIIVDTPRGQYSVPLIKVAENRADYYANKDGHDNESEEYKGDIDLIMNDDYEGIDWILNDTNWEDWECIATKVNDKVNVTDDDFWTSSEDFEIK